MRSEELNDLNETLFRQVWERASDAIALSDPEGTVLLANPAYFTLYGYTSDEVIGKSFAIIFPEEIREQAVEQYRVVFAGVETPPPFESVIQCADGTERTVESNATFLTSAGKRIAMISTVRDITDRKTIETALRESEERLRMLLESVHDYAVYTLDTQGIITSWNEGARRAKGYTADEIIGQPLHCFYIPEDVAARKPEREMETALAVGRSEDESWRVRKDGSLFWANEIMTPLAAHDGTLLGFTKITRDLSERRAAEVAVQLAEERLRLTLESINDHAIFTQDLDGQIIDWNTGAEQVFGYRAEEIVGQNCTMLFTPEDRANGVPQKEMLQARTSGRAADERWLIRKDGRRFYASGVLSPLESTTPIGYVKVARDLTEQKLTEEELRNLNETLEGRVEQRTEQVRQLVTQLTMSEQQERRRISSVLHDDLQQRLFSLGMQLRIVQNYLKNNQVAEANGLLEEFEARMRESIMTARSLAVDLSPPVLHNEGLVEALHWLAAQMEQQYGLIVTITNAGTWHPLHADLRVMLFHVVRELLFNIVQHAGVTNASVSLAPADDLLRIVVRDAGDGFDEKLESVENSQGLVHMRERLQLFDGRIEINSRRGRGTCVIILLPFDVLQQGHS